PPALPRAARARRRRRGQTRRAPAHDFHAVPLRRLYTARGQRDDGAQRIHGARPSVPRGTEAAWPAGREAVMWSRHAAEQQLYDCYYAERSGETIDPRLAEHLLDCASCSARFASIARLLDEIRTDAAAEADAVFTAERLRAQQQQIARRLEHAARPARVISFPRQAAPRTLASATVRVAPRWIAAAAGARDRRVAADAGRHPRHRPRRRRRRRCVSVRAGCGARATAHPRADRVRRVDTARARGQHSSLVPSLIFRKGLDLKHAVAGMLADNYHSALVEQVKADDFTYRAGRLTVHLAREFGFCYGVDRAV